MVAGYGGMGVGAGLIGSPLCPKGRDIHNWTYFACSIKKKMIVVRVYLVR